MSSYSLLPERGGISGDPDAEEDGVGHDGDDVRLSKHHVRG